MKLNECNEFESANGLTGVFAKKVRGRWQYRTEKGSLLASGMTPAEFCQHFWMRNDFESEVTV